MTTPAPSDPAEVRSVPQDPARTDPALARFRRGAAVPIGPVTPPPVLESRGQDPDGRLPEEGRDPISLASYPAPAHVAPPPSASSIRPLFDDFAPASPPSGEPEYSWVPDEVDRGRRSGIVALIVGVPFGLVGLIMGLFSVRASRRGGRVGGWGVAAIVVSLASMAVVASLAVSYATYQISLVRACATVAPGSYLTESGDEVTCR